MSLPQQAPSDPVSVSVIRLAAIDSARIDSLLGRYELDGITVAPGGDIPGSYWGAPEAGLVGRKIFFRADTPVHSLLHELAHFVCMAPERRQSLHTDAGGDDAEECAVCFLEVVLADYLRPFNAERCLKDMDAWGYSFREGRASDWFHGDGREACDWLRERGLIDARQQLTWRLRR